MKELINGTKCAKEDCFLCKNITPEWLEIVRLKREVLTFNKRQLIFEENQKVSGIYFILSGKVKIETKWGDRGYIVRLAGEGDILGHRGFGLDDVYPVSAIALETTNVCFIPTALFIQLLKTNADFLYKLAFFYAEELKRTERRMQNLVNMPVKGRVAESILYVKEIFGVDESGVLKYRMSRKDMAAMAGTVYETVIRMLNELVQDGCIELLERDIRIVHPERMKECCTKRLATE